MGTPEAVKSLPATEGAASASAETDAQDESRGPSRGVTSVGARRKTIRRRDAFYRRALAIADLAAITLAVLGAVAVGGGSLSPLGLLVPPVFVGVVKAMGLYDRDEHLLHKSTLDEVPGLFGIATLAVLLLSLTQDAFVDGGLDGAQVVYVWLALFLSLVCLRALARAAAGSFVPVERCLLVGHANEAEYVREKLMLSPAVKAELVGVVEPVETPGEGPPQPPSDLGATVETHDIERVILATGASTRDELLYTIRELKTFGVKVSAFPKLPVWPARRSSWTTSMGSPCLE